MHDGISLLVKKLTFFELESHHVLHDDVQRARVEKLEELVEGQDFVCLEPEELCVEPDDWIVSSGREKIVVCDLMAWWTLGSGQLCEEIAQQDVVPLI